MNRAYCLQWNLNHISGFQNPSNHQSARSIQRPCLLSFRWLLLSRWVCWELLI